MFETSLPWWHFVLRGAVVYGALLVLIRMSGKRTVGEFTPFDLVVVVLLGESVQGSLTGSDESIPGGLLVAVTLVGLNLSLGFLTSRSRVIDKIIVGEPVVLARAGKPNRRALLRNHVSDTDLEEAVRRAGLSQLTDVDIAVLETDGEITVVPKRPPKTGQE